MVPARTLTPSLRWTAAIAIAMLLAACGPDAKPDDAAADAVAQAAAAAFATDQQRWREQRRAELLAPGGWTSLVGLHWIDRGAHFVGSAGGNGIRLSMGPRELGLLDRRKDDAFRFVPAKDVALTLDGAPLAAPAVLHSDADPDGPSRIGFDEGRGEATVIRRGERYALRVKHADAPTRTGFAGLDYWPAERSWVVEGRFVPHPPGQAMEIANIVGTIERIPNPGAVEFARDGRNFRLEALDEGTGGLFLVFADRTNGHGSYGAGRFLDAAAPDARGRVVLDFNRSYNPPCAFTAFATCPLPPPENRLDLAVAAGEKAYAPGRHRP